MEQTDPPVELRIHGVGGAPPATVLGVQQIEPAPGTNAEPGGTGFYVPASPADRFLSDPDRQLEAYSWGDLTRAPAARAAWLLLAPFALTNLAGWMIEHDGSAVAESRIISAPDRISRALARLFAFTMTVGFVYLVSRTLFDVVVIQCGAIEACHQRWWLWPLDALASHPGRQLAVAALVPTGAIAGVAYLARRSQIVSTPAADVTVEVDPTFADSWKEPAFWSRFGVPHRLGIAHLATGLLVVAALTGGAADLLGSEWGAWIRSAALAGLALGAALVNLVRLPTWAFWLFLASGIAAAGAAIAVAFVAPPSSFPDDASAATVLASALVTSQIVLVGLLTLVTRRGRSRRARSVAPTIRLYRWILPPALMTAAAGLMAAVGAGAEILVRNLVENSHTGSIDVAPTAGTIASGYALALIALLVTALGSYLVESRRSPSLNDLAHEYDSFVDRPVLERIQRARVLARLTDHVPAMLVSAVAVLLGIVLYQLVQATVEGRPLGSGRPANPFAWMETEASALLILLPVLVGYAVIHSYRSGPVRSVIGVLWDVATFWPRHFHPFAPPSYGERTIPDIRARLQHHQSRGVLVSAHSQGSVLSLAAMAPPSVDLGVVGLVTTGSPVERLYARFFPEYVSARLMAEVDSRLEHRWINLYRNTDFIGGPIAGLVGDVALKDPERPDGSLQTHFDYESSGAYQDALRKLI